MRMLARRQLPEEYRAWNSRWKAPQGPSGKDLPPLSPLPSKRHARRLGPFVFQPNSTTREVEYPWAYFAVDPLPGSSVLEIGGALSGFQFVLAKSGAEVTNVDPFFVYGAGKFDAPIDPEAVHGFINECFGTAVKLCPTLLPDAGLPDESFDFVVSVSTIEHIPLEQLSEVLREVFRLLKHGSRFVVTLDLFINLNPFTDRQTNQWGSNISVEWLVRESGLRLISGEPSELYGFPEFDCRRILSSLEDYSLNRYYPQLAQLLILQKD
jgi:SAM-dependent methyltransferase